ncbi:MAG TPA: substrate-binding domain-containing protein [Mycobacteriales bacterium]|nr:substrate-binding domain-containing protein [Mycobacteriales bacterium]
MNTRSRRRAALASIASLVALGGAALVPAAAHADTSSTVTVVGTSDVFDSDLMQQVIKPGFEKAYPQYTLNYVSQGTGAAISYAEAGTASALLVHAASLENQFVASGYSYEQYGRAIFYGDYVLLGPASDPAGVMSGGNPAHNIVDAFQRIAAAGQDGNVNYVSRGGTPGTTVEEHTIWGLTTGVTTCPVSTANGGGAVPNADSNCASPTLPSWYHTTGLTQGPNVVNADACNYTGGNCYVLTDRATFQYLESEGALSNLHVVDNDPNTGPGGANLLVNSFHAYAINPAAFSSDPNVHINLQGALAFLDWLTSPTGQTAVNNYQANDPGGRSFKEDAAPALSATAASTSVKGGHKLTITGSLSNKVPGTPPLAGVQVTLSATPTGGKAALAATTTTSASGKFTFHYVPTGTASYTVSSPQISQVEIPASASFGPLYGDILQPTSAKVKGTIHVVGAVAISSAKARKGVVTIRGGLSPAVSGSGAKLRIYAGHASASGERVVRTVALKHGAKRFTVKIKLARGRTWKVRVKYVNAGVIVAGSSATKSVHVT